MKNKKIEFINNTMSRKLIYVYEKTYAEEKGFLKIGDTSVDTPSANFEDNSDYLMKMAEKRIRQFDRTSPIKILYCTIAVDDKFVSFRDTNVHALLVRSGFPKHTRGISTEWFNIDLSLAIQAINSVKKGESCITPDTKPVFEKLILRPEQEEAIIKAIDVFKSKKDVLWNAKMRFGKTVSALELVKRLKVKKTIIITHRPIVNSGWYEDFHKTFDTKVDNYSYFSKYLGKDQRVLETISDKENIILFASIQDLRDSSFIGGEFDKNEEIFNISWDLIIFDEAHEGTKTELAQKLVNSLTSVNTKTLKLSGTPFNLMNDYDESQIYTWDYIMEQEAKYNWEKQREGDSNPYSSLPQLHMFVYELGDIIKDDIFIDVVNKSFNFTEFFRVEDNKFVYHDRILSFLDIISSDSKSNNMPFSNQLFRDEIRHTLWTVPSRASGRLLEKMLLKHDVFSKYNIANLVDDAKENTKDMELIKQAITDKPFENYSITLTVRKGTVGVTVPEWTGILVLNNTEVATNYLQSIFRVQTPNISEMGIKEKGYIFDFAPDRSLKMLSESVNLNTKAGSLNNKKQKEKIEKLLNFLPIIGMSGNRMSTYSIETMLTQLKRAQAERAVMNGFDDTSIYNDELLKLNDIDIALFENLKSKIGRTNQSKKTNHIEVNSSYLSEEEWEKSEEANRKRPSDRTLEEQEILKKRRELQNQRNSMISILRGVSIRIPLMIYGMNIPISDDISLDNFSRLIDEESWEEFMPKGITKLDFKNIIKYYDSDVFLEAARRIRRSSLAANSLSPELRIEHITSIFNGFKNPDKETVLTPWRVINMHLGETLGGYNFFNEDYPKHANISQSTRFINKENITSKVFSKNSKILEINSKTGLYPLYMAFSIYKERFNVESISWTKSNWVEKDKALWNDVLVNNIFVLNKTEMAKTITYRTLVGFGDNNDFLRNLIVITDLTDKIRDNKEEIIYEIKRKLGDVDLKFNAIVGNPPYMEKRGNYNLQIHFDFLQMAFKLSTEYISLIQPLNWLNDQETLGLVVNNLEELHRFSDSTDVFNEVSIPSGVGFSLINKNEIFSKTIVFEKGEKRSFTITSNINIDDIRIKEEVKFINSIEPRLSSYIGHPNKNKSLNVLDDGDVEIWFKKESGKVGRNQWNKVSRKDIPDGVIIDEYKVMISKDGHAERSDSKPENIFNNRATVLLPGQITTDRPYLLKASDEIEANLIAEYANSKFFRRLLHIQSKASSISKSAFMDIPDIDEWKNEFMKHKNVPIDKFLFDFYDLSDETIKDINSRIAPK